MKKNCDSCGTCCRNGGPPLHHQDHALVGTGVLTFEDLVTIRRGELVIPPLSSKPVVAQVEWIKVQGHEGEWCCRFLDINTNRCTIYANRPVSCQALRCWDTTAILAMSGRELLCRRDLIREDDPLLPVILLQEEQAFVPDLDEIVKSLADHKIRAEVLLALTDKVWNDLNNRSLTASRFNISVAAEIFYFGRPLFQVLHSLGIETVETPRGISLQYTLR